MGFVAACWLLCLLNRERREAVVTGRYVVGSVGGNSAREEASPI